MINNLQAHYLFRSFMASEMLAQAEMTTGERITVDNVPGFLASWASALADGDSDPVLDALVAAEVAAAPAEPPKPIGTIPYEAMRCGGRAIPARWGRWNDMVRKSYLDRQVSVAAFRAALSIPEAAVKVGVTPWVLYAIADPRRFNDPTPDIFVRNGQSLGVAENKMAELKKLVS